MADCGGGMRESTSVQIAKRIIELAKAGERRPEGTWRAADVDKVPPRRRGGIFGVCSTIK